MNGNFNGGQSPWVTDHATNERRTQDDSLSRATAYRRRVVGRRVQVVSEVDFGAFGTIVDVDGADLVVILDCDPEERFNFRRDEIEQAS